MRLSLGDYKEDKEGRREEVGLVKGGGWVSLLLICHVMDGFQMLPFVFMLIWEICAVVDVSLYA